MATPNTRLAPLPHDDLEQLFLKQRAAHSAQSDVPATLRIDRMDRCIDLLVSHQNELCDAAASDFGQRPAAVTLAMDIMPSVLALKHARGNLGHWMRPSRRRLHLPLLLPGTRAEILYQPLGVVGIISPWNFPIGLCFGPLASALAAGNRCLIKPSESTPAVANLLQQCVSAAFDRAELAVVTGGAEVARRFSALPFDHLLFTGSPEIGRRVMAAASTHLVPVTLELGGKCPVIIGRRCRIEMAVDRILIGKLANAGQVCLAPDHVFIPRALVDEFVAQARTWVQRAYPGMPMNPDYTSIINDRHYERLEALQSDAVARGARIVSLSPGEDVTSRARRLYPPAIVLGTTDEMRIMQEEIFGPLLPVVPYDDVDEAISSINARPHPLALYYFGRDAAERERILARTRSGGVTINDVAMHFLASDLPFGGVGESGMGAYHGEHGFHRLSHARSVLQQSQLDFARFAGSRPPYGQRLQSSLEWLIRR